MIQLKKMKTFYVILMKKIIEIFGYVLIVMELLIKFIQKFKFNLLLKQVNDYIDGDIIVCNIDKCEHDVVFYGMCAKCGMKFDTDQIKNDTVKLNSISGGYEVIVNKNYAGIILELLNRTRNC